jgi:sugar O-acyltransferase (sialic acid O-acetyltransferase NeuD family)
MNVKNASQVIKDVIVWGAKGHAKVLMEIIQGQGLNLKAIFDNDRSLRDDYFKIPIGQGVDGFLQWAENHALDDSGFLVAIGGDRGKDRYEISQFLCSKKLTPLCAIHPSAYIAKSATIGIGVQILTRSIVCVDVHVGDFSIINTGASVDHESVVGKGVHICPGARLAGCVVVEDFAMIGTGAVILPRVKIGKHAIVGAGAVVVRDVAPYTVVVGNPARFLRKVGLPNSV